ncbi:MAG: DUF4402 domain-containing protein [Sphingomicrobium sp.]
MTQVVTISASVPKPLTLSWLQNLDLGTIALGPGTWSGATVSLSRAGTLTCASANLTCSGVATTAKYNTTGSNNLTVRISAPNVLLTNQSDPTKTLTLIVDNPGSLVLTSSGVPGVDFSLGGAITLGSTTATGVYSGTFNVTVDY